MRWIFAPSSLVSALLGAFEEGSDLCAELNALIISGFFPTGTRIWEDKTKKIEAKFDQLRGRAAAFMDKRRSNMSAH
jgi:hypothetical protein